jgi:hypothetical protein
MWTASLGANSSGLNLNIYSGFVHSGKPVAEIMVIANGTGLNDTARSGPIATSISFNSTSKRMLRSDFVDGTDVRTIKVQLTIVAVPDIQESYVIITSSSGRPVQSDRVDAGDRLTVAVYAFDFERRPISRPDLLLSVELEGKLNKVSASLPLRLVTGTNIYNATIPENWIREPEEIKRDILPMPCHATANRLRSVAMCVYAEVCRRF